VQLSAYISAIEEALGKKAIQNLLPMQPGDVPATNADVAELMAYVGYKPVTKMQDGVKNFVKWYLNNKNI